jgi:hypothetical protein
VERRATPRRPISLAGSFTDAAGVSRLCELVDISGGGCRIRFDGEAPPVGPVTLTTAGGSTRARLVWSAGGYAGLMFPSEPPIPAGAGFLRSLWERITD